MNNGIVGYPNGVRLLGTRPKQEKLYSATGSPQTFVVPTGVKLIDVEAVGASGGSGNATGGKGARVRGTLSVTPGATLNIYVGGEGAAVTAGYNGGGASNSGWHTGYGGGGGSDIRIGGTALTDRVISAGGGGGAGANGTGSPNVGGHAAMYLGENGSGTGGGFGASTTAGGAAGGAGGATAGTLGQGGQANTSGSIVRGGGGGGGYYGGGGATGQLTNTDAPGGGGGSSLVPSGGTGQGSYNIGNGYIIIKWRGNSYGA